MTTQTPDHPPVLFRGRPDDPKDLPEVIHQAIGAASVCWESMEGTGVFLSDRAAKIAQEVLDFLCICEGGPDHRWEDRPMAPNPNESSAATPDDLEALRYHLESTTTLEVPRHVLEALLARVDYAEAGKARDAQEISRLREQVREQKRRGDALGHHLDQQIQETHQARAEAEQGPGLYFRPDGGITLRGGLPEATASSTLPPHRPTRRERFCAWTRGQ